MLNITLFTIELGEKAPLPMHKCIPVALKQLNVLGVEGGLKATLPKNSTKRVQLSQRLQHIGAVFTDVQDQHHHGGNNRKCYRREEPCNHRKRKKPNQRDPVAPRKESKNLHGVNMRYVLCTKSALCNAMD